jgi:carboxymethylenebutenolidase
MNFRLPSLLTLALLFGCTGHHDTTMHDHDHSSQTATASNTTTAAPQRAATPVTNQTFKTATGEATGYLATPSSSGKHPAIIVIQEWWGLDEWIRQNADRFAGQGYVALAPDLYHGHVATTPDEAHELMRGLPEDRAIADLKGAFEALAARPDVDPARIGVIGWCMGGGYALQFTAAEPRLAASVVNYGHLLTDSQNIARIKAPLLGNFGEADRGIPAADVTAFEKTLRSQGKSADFKLYPAAGHGFMNPNNQAGYSKAAAGEAWKRIDDFFGARLKP